MATESKRQSVVLGIDIGGSGIKGAPVDVSRGVLVGERLRIPTPRPAAPEAVASVVSEIIGHFGWSGPVGCTFPAVIKDGVAHTASNVDQRWIGTDGKRLFESKTACSLTLLNDADAAGLAEMRFGAGRGQGGLVIMLTLGTGIGSALFIDGRLVPNTELGHLIINGKPAEEQASSRARKQQTLSWKKWAARLDAYLRYLESLLSPDLYILGGGISKRHQRFLPRLSCATSVIPAEMRNEAGIVGAALAAG